MRFLLWVSSSSFKGFIILFTNSTFSSPCFFEELFNVFLELEFFLSWVFFKYLHFPCFLNGFEIFSRRCRLKSTCFCYSRAHKIFFSSFSRDCSQPGNEQKSESQSKIFSFVEALFRARSKARAKAPCDCRLRFSFDK